MTAPTLGFPDLNSYLAARCQQDASLPTRRTRLEGVAAGPAQDLRAADRPTAL